MQFLGFMPVWLVNNNCSLLVVFVAFFDSAACHQAVVVSAALLLGSGRGCTATVFPLLDCLQVIVVVGRDSELGWLHLCAVGRQGLQWIATQCQHLVDFVSLSWLACIVSGHGAYRIRRFARGSVNTISFIGAAILIVAFDAFFDDAPILDLFYSALGDHIAGAIFLPVFNLDCCMLSRTVV